MTAKAAKKNGRDQQIFCTFLKNLIMRKKLLSLCFVLSAFLFSTHTTAQVMSNDDLKALMTADWQRAKAYTLEYMNNVEETLLSLESMQNSITILHNTINALRAEIGKIQGIALSIQRQKELLQETEREWKIQTKGICPICGGKL